MSTIGIGRVQAFSTGHAASLGRNEPPAVLEDLLAELLPEIAGVAPTNLAEASMQFKRDPAVIVGGIPMDFPDFGCFSASTMTLGNVNAVYPGLHSDPMDIDLLMDNRWQPNAGDFTPPGSGPGKAQWAPEIGAQVAEVWVTAQNLSAHPSTGVVLDSNSQYWARSDEISRPALTMDMNPVEITLGAPITAFTVALAAVIYEVSWRVTDIISVKDIAAPDPEAATLLALRLDADEMQLWIRGRQVAAEILTPHGMSLSNEQRYLSRKPYLIVFSVDVSNVGPGQPGTANLVIIDTTQQYSIEASFSNDVSDTSFGTKVFVGRPGSENYATSIYDPNYVGAMARMDLMDLAMNTSSALSLEECQARAGKLDAIYGVTL